MDVKSASPSISTAVFVSFQKSLHTKCPIKLDILKNIYTVLRGESHSRRPYVSATFEKVRRFGRWFFGFRPTPLPKTLPDLSVTVIVPAYNEEESIANTIESILEQTYPITHIIVVDDHSMDRTNEIASAYAARYPQVEVVRTHVNQKSKSMAQNYVLDRVKTDLFVTIDGDTMLHPEAIARTLPFFHSPKTIVVCGFVIPQKITTFWERARFIEYLYGLTIVKPAQDHWRTIMVASGCFSIFRTVPVREEFGGFKKRTIVEDMDLTWEVVAAGYDAYFAPDALCFPVEPATLKVMFSQLDRWYSGFFQCLKVRGNLFKHNKRIAIAAYGYMIWSFVGGLTIPWIGWAVTNNVWLTLLVVILSSLIFAGLPAFYKAHQLRMLRKAITSFPAFIFITYFNLAIYLYAGFMEVVMKRNLSSWTKGH